MDKKKLIDYWHHKKYIRLVVLPVLIGLLLITTSYVTNTQSPSGYIMPVGDIPGWRQIFVDDFKTNVPLGSFPTAVSSKWMGYQDGYLDTSKNGTYYPSKVVSISNSIMNLYLHTEVINGTPTHLVAAPVPILPGAIGSEGGLLYGRYAICFRTVPISGSTLYGYKTAWLLWPDSEIWPRDGEIDFPEGDLNDTINAAVHYQGGLDGNDQDVYNSLIRYDTKWHIAIIEWMPTYIKFILDGVTIGNSTNKIPNTPMHFVIQTETSIDGTVPNNSTGNVQIDWIAIYSPSYVSQKQQL